MYNLRNSPDCVLRIGIKHHRSGRTAWGPFWDGCQVVTSLCGYKVENNIEYKECAKALVLYLIG